MWPYATKKDKENHAVTLVGWGQEKLKNGTIMPYWVVSARVDLCKRHFDGSGHVLLEAQTTAAGSRGRWGPVLLACWHGHGPVLLPDLALYRIGANGRCRSRTRGPPTGERELRLPIVLVHVQWNCNIEWYFESQASLRCESC